MFSKTKQQASERKREVESLVYTKESCHNATVNELSKHRKNMRAEIDVLRTDAENAEENMIAALGEKLTGVMEQRDIVEGKLKDCYRNYEALMDGTEYSRIQGEVSEKELEVDALCTPLSSTEKMTTIVACSP
jgi:hypothetical protein